jgi:lysophospholipase L1-like esterase
MAAIVMVVLAAVTAAPSAEATPVDAAPADARWVASWTAAPQAYTPPVAAPGSPASAPALPRPVASFKKQTLRQQLQPTLGGKQVRLRFSNVFGRVPLHIAAASVGRSTGPDAMSPSTLRPLRFGGQADVTIAPGAEAWSDAAALEVKVGQMLAVSSFLDRETPLATAHQLPSDATRLGSGNSVAAPRLQNAAPSGWNHFVTGLDVWTAKPARVVVAFGDSITDGAGAGDVDDSSYPVQLARRLRDSPSTAQAIAVLNAGIAGNRLLTDGAGPRAVARFGRDVLSQSAVTHAIVLIGINDIGLAAFAGVPGNPMPPADAPTADRITAGLQQLIDQAHAHGVKILVGTLLPFKGAPYWTEGGEAMRQAVNRWIRSRPDIDSVIDFDAVLRDPGDPRMLHPLYDSGDHLHPGSVGYAAMAAAIDLRELLE